MALHEAMPSLVRDPIEPLLDVTRAAHLLGISPKTLRDWIQDRRIEYVKPRHARDVSARNHSTVHKPEHSPSRRLMKVFKRSGSSHYHYKFQYRGREYYRSTGTENRREAEAIAAAARTRIIRQAAGLEEPEAENRTARLARSTVPNLRQFQKTFDEWVGTAKAERMARLSFTAKAIASCSPMDRGLIFHSIRSTSVRSKCSRLGL